MKTRTWQRTGWWAAAVIAGVLLVAWWGARATINYTSALSCSAQDPGTGGGLGVFLWAQKLDLPVRSLRDPLWEAVQGLDSPQGNCFLTAGNGAWSPWEETLSAEQWASLRRWISRGNTLVIVTTKPEKIPKIIVGDLLQPPPALALSPKAAVRRRPEEKEIEEFFSASVAADPKVESVMLEGLFNKENKDASLSVRADGPRWRKVPPSWTAAGDARGTVLHRVPLGQGSVYFLLDDFAWTNSGFDANGNAAALAALLAREVRGGTFGFDEYRHGHGRVESFAGYLLSLPGATAFCWMAVVLACAYVLGRNVRFGPADDYHVSERRTAREYIDAAAYLNQRARAAPLALDSVVRRLRYLSSQRGRSTPELEQTLRQAERLAHLAERPAKPVAASSLVRKLVILRKQCYGS